MNSKLFLTTAITAVESKMFLVQTETKDQYEESPQLFESEVDTELPEAHKFESEVDYESHEDTLFESEVGSAEVLMYYHSAD